MPLEAEGLVFVAGAGTMGLGIAEVAARAGHPVRVFDASVDVLERARQRIGSSFAKLIERGKLSADAAARTLARIEIVRELDAAAPAMVVVEAVSEDLSVKRELFARFEAVIGEGCVLATNTSSLSITALSKGLRHPERLVGMHFFNPVPLMQLVEVVSGLHTSRPMADAVCELARRWGKVPIHVRSTPGFVVNRVARPFYAEALALLRERAADPDAIDVCVRGAGFRMGPCELMDLIGHDVNLAVTESVFEAMYGDKRFAPSPLQRELVAGGLLGRKSGRGFFEYRDGIRISSPVSARFESSGALPDAEEIVLHGRGEFVERWAGILTQAERTFAREPESRWLGLSADGRQLRMTDGRPAGLVAVHERVPDMALFDLPLGSSGTERAALAWSPARTASPNWQRLAHEWIAAVGFSPRKIGDAAGLIVARIVAMLINEAADAVLQGVADEQAVDAAMTLAVNYPAGPFAWLERWHVCEVVRLLDHLDDQARGERYRVSPELRQRAWACEGGGHGRRRFPAPTSTCREFN